MDYLHNDEPGRIRHEFSGDGAYLQSRPTKELVKDFFADARVLVKEELALAKADAQGEVKKVSRAGAAFGMGGAFMHVALFAIAACLVAVFEAVLLFQLWAAALIVAGIFAFFGLIALLYGKSRLKKLQAGPAIQNLKEDQVWAKDTMQTIRSRRHANA